jgi:hypothetical protein
VENTQTITALAGYGYHLRGSCPCETPGRRIDVDLAQLARAVGDITVPEAMRRIVCAGCGAHVSTQVHAVSARHSAPSERPEPR